MKIQTTSEDAFVAVDREVATFFEIEELTGLKRRLSLSGRCLPKQPFTLGNRHRFEITKYGGSPVASSQGMGAEFDNTSVNGKWSDRYLNDLAEGTLAIVSDPSPGGISGALETVHDLTEFVESLVAHGQVVRVSWGEKVRIGHLEAFKQEWIRATDLAWEMEFIWLSAGDPPTAIAPVGYPDPIGSFQKLVGRQADAVLVVHGMDGPPDFLSQMASLMDGVGDKLDVVQGQINAFDDAVSAWTTGLLSPLEMYRKAAGITGGVVGRANEALALLESRCADSFVGAYQDTLSAGANTIEGLAGLTDIFNVGASLRLTKYMRVASGTIRRARNEAATSQADFMAQIDPAVLAIVSAREGENLREISTKYYGSQSNWQYLMRYNDLQSSVLHAGQIVYVPKSVPPRNG